MLCTGLGPRLQERGPAGVADAAGAGGQSWQGDGPSRNAMAASRQVSGVWVSGSTEGCGDQAVQKLVVIRQYRRLLI